ncbi:MAG: hypothetical protein EPN48_03225 [Microbacteriaceae bacterium]|nr:MAG: hypothetical protein EPN48_03225 [Microbacteriaceae bacterium]
MTDEPTDADEAAAAVAGAAAAAAGEPRSPVSVAPGILIIVGGLLVAAWIGVGRFPFGIAGSLTPLYVFIALIILGLQAATGRALIRGARAGYAARGWTIAIVLCSWAFGILCGLTLPDATPSGLQTIVSGSHEPGLGIAIGVTNPAGMICAILSVAAVILAYRDARGGRPVYDEDGALDAWEQLHRH